MSSTPCHERVRTHNFSGDRHWCTGSCKSNNHTIMATTSVKLQWKIYICCHFSSSRCCRNMIFQIILYMFIGTCHLHFNKKTCGLPKKEHCICPVCFDWCLQYTCTCIYKCTPLYQILVKGSCGLWIYHWVDWFEQK